MEKIPISDFRRYLEQRSAKELIDEPFYHSMESMYERAANWAVKNEIAEQFQERFRQIVFDAEDIGWGFYDNLAYL